MKARRACPVRAGPQRAAFFALVPFGIILQFRPSSFLAADAALGFAIIPAIGKNSGLALGLVNCTIRFEPAVNVPALSGEIAMLVE